MNTAFKNTEIGRIPVEWEVVKLGELGKFSKGAGIRKDESLSGELPCVRYGELYTRHNYFISKFYSFISKAVSLQAKRLKTGDILFAGSGETKEEIGKSVAFIDSFEAYAGGDIVIFSPINTNSLFLGYLLNFPIIQKQKSNRGQGDAVVHISANQLSNIQVPLPPLPEQTAIAAALSDADALIAAAQKLLQKKKALKQGLMQQLLMPKAGWEVKKLGEVAKYKNGKSYENNIVENGNYFLITLNSLDINGKLKNEHLQTNLLDGSLNKGDLIMILSDVAHGNFLGLTDIIPEDNKYVLNQRVGALTNVKEVNPYFLRMFINLNQKYFKLNGQGSSQQNLGKESIVNFEVYFPSSQEQNRICNILTDADNAIAALERKITKLQAQKQGMMQALLTGKIRLAS